MLLPFPLGAPMSSSSRLDCPHGFYLCRQCISPIHIFLSSSYIHLFDICNLAICHHPNHWCRISLCSVHPPSDHDDDVQSLGSYSYSGADSDSDSDFYIVPLPDCFIPDRPMSSSVTSVVVTRGESSANEMICYKCDTLVSIGQNLLSLLMLRLEILQGLGQCHDCFCPSSLNPSTIVWLPIDGLIHGFREGRSAKLFRLPGSLYIIMWHGNIYSPQKN